MTSTELYKQGRLQAALDAQLADVKAKPADHGKRLFLFELAVFAGDLERAKRQLDAVQYDEAERQFAADGYRRLLEAETKRRAVFKGTAKPMFFSPPPDHVHSRLEALALLNSGRAAEASEALAKANEQAPAVAGMANGKPFAGLRDADDLLGGTLEVMAKGEYFWVPVEQIDSIAATEPKFPRDLYWFPVRLTLVGGQTGEAFLPVLYHGSHESADESLKLGRSTDWKEAAGAPVTGVGAKVFLVGDDGMAATEWRELQVFSSAAPA